MIKPHPLLRSSAVLVSSMLAVYIVLMAFTGISPFARNPYNTYSLQAQSWLQGRLDLGQNYSHLEISEFEGKFYSCFPAFPSVVMLPFVAIFGSSTPDHLITLLAALLAGFFCLRIALRLGLGQEESVFFALFATVGSNFLFFSFNGGVWFMAQTFAFAFSAAAIWFAISSKAWHGHLSLFFWAAAVGSRPFSIVYFPLLAILLFRRLRRLGENPLGGLYYLIAPATLAIFYSLLNYVRFGSIFDFGRAYLPEFVLSTHGQFSLYYARQNLPKLLLPPPIRDGRVVFPRFDGFAFYLASPIVLSFVLYWLNYALRPLKQKKDLLVVVLAPLLVALNIFLLLLHRTMGGWHFGNRYPVDALPWLFFALAVLKGPRRFRLFDRAFFLFGLVLNAVGTVALYNNWLP